VLLEPRYDKFEEFLDPLLTAPGSRYSLVAGDPTVLQTYRDLITNGVFPHQTVLDADDPRAQEPNNTLLVTGSLVWDPRLPGLGFDSMAKQLAYHFATAAWTNDLFHAFGLVRTLLWVQAEDFSPMVADTVSSMQKTTRIMEMTQNTNVFVAPERPPRSVGRGSPGRDPQYEIESTVRALRRGREHGIELPPHRRADIHDFAEDIEQTSNGTGISSHSEMHNYLREQQLAGKNTVGLLSEGLIDHLEERKYIAKKYPEINLDPDPKTKKRQKPPPDHPHGAQISKFFKNIALTNLAFRNKALASSVADIGEKIYNLECKILRMKDGRRKDSAMAKLDELNKKWNHGVESQNTNYSKASATEVDDRNAIRSPPCPLLGWDDRPFEPIVMRNDEVWPRNRLSLISGEPIPRPLDDSSDFHEWVTDFVFGLYSTPSDAVNHALDKMQHGLSDIINECPSLKDPERGGRLQMEHLRVRMLTNEMIIELVKAYKNWPFKEPGSDQATYFKNKYQGHAIPGGGA
jgi:transcription factor 1